MTSEGCLLDHCGTFTLFSTAQIQGRMRCKFPIAYLLRSCLLRPLRLLSRRRPTATRSSTITWPIPRSSSRRHVLSVRHRDSRRRQRLPRLHFGGSGELEARAGRVPARPAAHLGTRCLAGPGFGALLPLLHGEPDGGRGRRRRTSGTVHRPQEAVRQRHRRTSLPRRRRTAVPLRRAVAGLSHHGPADGQPHRTGRRAKGRSPARVRLGDSQRPRHGRPLDDQARRPLLPDLQRLGCQHARLRRGLRHQHQSARPVHPCREQPDRPSL